MRSDELRRDSLTIHEVFFFFAVPLTHRHTTSSRWGKNEHCVLFLHMLFFRRNVCIGTQLTICLDTNKITLWVLFYFYAKNV